MSQTVCVMPQNHPLAALKVVDVQDLRGVPMILLGRSRATRREMDELFWRSGIEPKVRVEAHSVASACGLVASGIGVSLVNEMMAADFSDLPIQTRPLAQSLPNYFAFATPSRGQPTVAAANFIKTAVEVLGEI